MSMMRFLSLLLCAVALFCRAMQTYKRAGNPVVEAEIVGFYQTSGFFGKNRNLVVRFEFQGKKIDAMTLESSAVKKHDQENLIGKKVEVFVSEKNPAIVSLRHDHSLDLYCGFLLLIGMIGLLFG